MPEHIEQAVKSTVMVARTPVGILPELWNLKQALLCQFHIVQSITEQIHANPFQSIHSPLRILSLIIIQFRKEVPQKRGISILDDSLPHILHQVELIVDVMHGQEMCSSSLFRCDVVDVCSNDAQAAIIF